MGVTDVIIFQNEHDVTISEVIKIYYKLFDYYLIVYLSAFLLMCFKTSEISQ